MKPIQSLHSMAALSSTHIKLIQAELKRLGYDPGPIDGDAGKLTKAALAKVHELPAHWTFERKLVGFIQLKALKEGINPGPFDGLWGPRTENAFDQLAASAAITEVHWAANHIINRAFFIDQVKQSLFGGSISVKQMEGIDAILTFWQGEHPQGDDRHLAYMLATTYHETDRKMQPIEEYGKGRGRPYGLPDPHTGQTYFGRGFVQLTWKANYEEMSKLVGADLVNIPSLALDLGISTRILFIGMFRGIFTGKKLSDYFNATKEDWFNARKIINGTDRANDIANYAKVFYSAIAYKP